MYVEESTLCESVLDDFSILGLRSHFQLFLSLHVAVRSHRTQVASVHRQQHHGGRKSTVSHVSKAFSRQHDDDDDDDNPKWIKSRYNKTLVRAELCIFRRISHQYKPYSFHFTRNTNCCSNI